MLKDALTAAWCIGSEAAGFLAVGALALCLSGPLVGWYVLDQHRQRRNRKNATRHAAGR